MRLVIDSISNHLGLRMVSNVTKTDHYSLTFLILIHIFVLFATCPTSMGIFSLYLIQIKQLYQSHLSSLLDMQ